MNDPTIRGLLRQTELAPYLVDQSSKVVEELKLPVAGARIDFAVFNCHLHGFEIKSAVDTLQRLPNQLIAYSKVFDYLTIVTELKYHERILHIVPHWVGVSICWSKGKENFFDVIQPPSYNDNKDGFYIAQLLWHSELVDLIKEAAIPFRKHYRRWILCELLANNFNTPDLAALVRTKIKQRKTWRLEEAIQ